MLENVSPRLAPHKRKTFKEVPSSGVLGDFLGAAKMSSVIARQLIASISSQYMFSSSINYTIPLVLSKVHKTLKHNNTEKAFVSIDSFEWGRILRRVSFGRTKRILSLLKENHMDMTRVSDSELESIEG